MLGEAWHRRGAPRAGLPVPLPKTRTVEGRLVLGEVLASAEMRLARGARAPARPLALRGKKPGARDPRRAPRGSRDPARRLGRARPTRGEVRLGLGLQTAGTTAPRAKPTHSEAEKHTHKRSIEAPHDGMDQLSILHTRGVHQEQRGEGENEQQSEELPIHKRRCREGTRAAKKSVGPVHFFAGRSVLAGAACSSLPARSCITSSPAAAIVQNRSERARNCKGLPCARSWWALFRGGGRARGVCAYCRFTGATRRGSHERDLRRHRCAHRRRRERAPSP